MLKLQCKLQSDIFDKSSAKLFCQELDELIAMDDSIESAVLEILKFDQTTINASLLVNKTNGNLHRTQPMGMKVYDNILTKSMRQDFAQSLLWQLELKDKG